MKLPAYVRGTHCGMLWRVWDRGSSVQLLCVSGVTRLYSRHLFRLALTFGTYKEEKS